MEPIEREMRKIWDDAKKGIPNLRNLTFTITAYSPDVWGFIHIGENCEEWRGIDELQKIIDAPEQRRKKNPILFRNFKGDIK